MNHYRIFDENKGEYDALRIVFYWQVLQFIFFKKKNLSVLTNFGGCEVCYVYAIHLTHSHIHNAPTWRSGFDSNSSRSCISSTDLFYTKVQCSLHFCNNNLPFVDWASLSGHSHSFLLAHSSKPKNPKLKCLIDWAVKNVCLCFGYLMFVTIKMFLLVAYFFRKT